MRSRYNAERWLSRPQGTAVATLERHGGEVSAGSVPTFELTLNTSLLSDFNAYPLHAFANEPESFFCNRGYGRLSMYFAILHSLCLSADVTVRCNNVVTSYLMFLLVRPADPPSASADIETEPPCFLHRLLQRENTPPRMRDFQDFAAWHSAEVQPCLPVMRACCVAVSLAPPASLSPSIFMPHIHRNPST